MHLKTTVGSTPQKDSELRLGKFLSLLSTFSGAFDKPHVSSFKIK